jgi:hypothetical protein
MATPNASLRELQATLVRQHNKLNGALDDVTDAPTAGAIVREMQEITHRITLSGQLLFARRSAQLQKKVDGVKKATARVNKALQTLENVQGLLDATTDLLTLVDDAIDLAKTLA